MRNPFKGNATALAIGALAVAIASTGTAYAVTATTVNLADPTTPTNIAHVDGQSRLWVSDPVAKIDASGVFYGFSLPAVYPLTSPTTVQLAVTDLNYDNSRNFFEPNSDFQATLVKVTVGSSGTCADTDRVVTPLHSDALLKGTSVDVPFATPLVVKPTGTAKYCLALQLTGIDSAAPSELFATYCNLIGYSYSGTYTGTGSAFVRTPAPKLNSKERHAPTH
jgi:hypothetical protein